MKPKTSWLDHYHANTTAPKIGGESELKPAARNSTATRLTPMTGYSKDKTYNFTKGQSLANDIGVGLTPVLGDAVDIYQAIKAVKENDPLGVILNTTGAFLPMVSGQALESGAQILGDEITKRYVTNKKYQEGGKIFLQPNSPKLKQGYNIPSKYPSTELAISIGGENGEPAYLIPSFKQGHLLNNPVKEFNNTGEYLGGPFKTWQEADKWEHDVRHPYVEKGQPLPSPLKWWGNTYGSGGSVKPITPQVQFDSTTYENNIKNNYQSFLKNNPSVNLPKGMENKNGMNCINGVCNFINGASGLELKNGTYPTQIGKGKSYGGNATFNDNSEKEGFYRLNKEDLTRDGFKPGDVVQYSKYKMNAHRFDGDVNSNNAFDLYPQHAKIIVDKYDKNGKTYYKILDNGGETNYRTKDLSEDELMTHFNKGYHAGLGHNYAGLIVQRYNPNEVLNRQNNRKIEQDVLKGINSHAKEYESSNLPAYDFSESDPIQGKVKTNKSEFADKLMNVYKQNYKQIGNSSNLPPSTLNKLAIAQIGIAGQETKFGNDEGTLKSLVPDNLLDETRKLKASVSKDENWVKDYYNKNSKDKNFKKEYPNYSDFEKNINNKYGDSSGRGEYFYVNSPRSKGVFQQKELSKTGNYLVKDKELKDFDSQAIGSLALSIDNYHRLQKKYPKLTEDQLVDLTILSHNAPGKALIPEYVKYYLEHKDIDYVNKVKQNIPSYTEVKDTKKQIQKVNKDLSPKEVDSLKNFLATNTMIQKHKKGGRILGLYEMMGMPIPFGLGGEIWSGVKNAVLFGADNLTSVVNQDIIGDKQYTGKSAKTFQDMSHVTGSVANAAAPLAATAIGGPAAGMAVSAVQGTSNNFIKPDQDRYKSNTGMFMNSIDPLLKTASAMGSMSMSQPGAATPAKKAEGGSVDGQSNKTVINVEGGELEVNPQDLKIVKEFRNKPKHPAYGIDEQGNTLSTVGNIIIPTKLREAYKRGDTLRKKAIINNLQFDQAKREGMKYEYGGKIKKYDGSNGSVVGPRADGGFYNFNDTFNTNTPTAPVNAYNNLVGMPPVGNGSGNQIYTGVGSPFTDINFNPTQGVLPKTNTPNYISPMNTNGMKYTPTGINFNPSNDISSVAGTNKFSTSPSKPFDWSRTADVATKVGEYSPAIYNIGRGIFDKALTLNENDYLVNDQVAAPTLTGDAGRRDLLKGYNLAKYNNRQLGGTQAGMNNLFNNYADASSKFNENLENTNKVAKFEASKYNIENKFRNSQTKLGIKQFNEQNKAEKRNQISKGLTQTSDIIQNERNNKIIGNNLPNFLKYYNYDDKTGSFTLKTKTGG